MHDRFRFEQDGWGNHLCDGIEPLQNGMRLGEVFAGGAQFFPDERHRVQPKDFHALVGEEEHLFAHTVKDHRVAVIQVPLIRMESGPNPGLNVFEPGESARVFIRKNFPQSFFVKIGHSSVRENSIHIAVIRIAGFGFESPFMLVGSVVDHQVQHQADPLGAQVPRELRQLGHGTQGRVHFPEGADGISAVVFVFRHFEERHEMQIGQPKLFEIRNFRADAFQVASEKIYITHAAQHLVGLEPKRVLLALPVEFSQIVRSVKSCLCHALQQVFEVKEHVIASAV